MDDNEDILDTFQEFFKIMGYRVSIAQNVITAIKKLKTNVIDLIITDYYLPDYSGESLIQEIRNGQITGNVYLNPSIPVILLTGYGGHVDHFVENKITYLRRHPIDLLLLEGLVQGITRKINLIILNNP